MQIQEAIAALCIDQGVLINSRIVQGISIENYRLIFANRLEAIFFRRIIDGEIQN